MATQLTKQQQSISGVNLDEEYGNLQRYQQYYLANAQVLQTASTLLMQLSIFAKAEVKMRISTQMMYDQNMRESPIPRASG